MFVSWRDDLPPPYQAVTDGEHIWMRKGLLQVERRCTLAHELTHIDLGHTAHQDDAVEARVRRCAARRLLSVDQLVPIALWTQDVGEAADELWVTVEVLEDFLDSLSPSEIADIEAAVSAAKEA